MRKFATASAGALFLAALVSPGLADNGSSNSVRWETIIGDGIGG